MYLLKCIVLFWILHLFVSPEFKTLFLNLVIHDFNSGCSNYILMNLYKSQLKFLFLIKVFQKTVLK
jgi:hypothetical protein